MTQELDAGNQQGTAASRQTEPPIPPAVPHLTIIVGETTIGMLRAGKDVTILSGQGMVTLIRSSDLSPDNYLSARDAARYRYHAEFVGGKRGIYEGSSESDFITDEETDRQLARQGK